MPQDPCKLNPCRTASNSNLKKLINGGLKPLSSLEKFTLTEWPRKTSITQSFKRLLMSQKSYKVQGIKLGKNTSLPAIDYLIFIAAIVFCSLVIYFVSQFLEGALQ